MSRAPSRDYYFRRAKAEDYPARSVYKLKEMDQKLGLFKPGRTILDLGASPGSWSQYAAERVGPSGRVVAVDLKPPARDMAGVEWLVADVFAPETAAILAARGPYDAVVSDMAPSTTGHKGVDAARSAALAERAVDLAREMLKPGGMLVVKVFMGPDYEALLKRVRREFRRGRAIKPAACLKESKETYLFAAEPLNVTEES